MIWNLIEKDILPLELLKIGVKYLCSERLKEQTKKTIDEESLALQKFIKDCKDSPLAVLT